MGLVLHAGLLGRTIRTLNTAARTVSLTSRVRSMICVMVFLLSPIWVRAARRTSKQDDGMLQHVCQR